MTVSKKWGLPAIGWVPQELTKDGSYYHLARDIRVELYSTIKRQIEEFWGKAGKPPIVALCKETYDVRKVVDIKHGKCNCQKWRLSMSIISIDRQWISGVIPPWSSRNSKVRGGGCLGLPENGAPAKASRSVPIRR